MHTSLKMIHSISEYDILKEDEHEYVTTNCTIAYCYWSAELGAHWLFRFDLVAAIFGGQASAFARIVYALVGIAGLINLVLLFKPTEELGRTEPKMSRT